MLGQPSGPPNLFATSIHAFFEVAYEKLKPLAEDFEKRSKEGKLQLFTWDGSAYSKTNRGIFLSLG